MSESESDPRISLLWMPAKYIIYEEKVYQAQLCQINQYISNKMPNMFSLGGWVQVGSGSTNIKESVCTEIQIQSH